MIYPSKTPCRSDEHDFDYENAYRDPCYDGYNFIQTCKACGATSFEYYEYHGKRIEDKEGKIVYSDFYDELDYDQDEILDKQEQKLTHELDNIKYEIE